MAADPNESRPPRRLRLTRKRLLAASVAVLLVLAALAVAWGTYAVLPYSLICANRWQHYVMYAGVTPQKFDLRAENLWVETEAEISLRGWFIHANGNSLGTPARGTVFLLHGSDSCKEAMLGLARRFAEAGFNSLLFDMRAHGESGGKYRTFGFYEKRDCTRILDEAQRRFGDIGPVAVYGDSMGGAIALQFMASDPRVRCGVVASTFATLREISYDYFQHIVRVRLPWLVDRAIPKAERLANFSVDAVKPEEAVRHIDRPILLIHGMADRNISIRYGERIFQNLHAPGCEWYPVPNGDHGNLWKIGGEAYARKLVDFVAAHDQ